MFYMLTFPIKFKILLNQIRKEHCLDIQKDKWEMDEPT